MQQRRILQGRILFHIIGTHMQTAAGGESGRAEFSVL